MNPNLIDELKYSIGGDNYRINKYITIYIPYVYEIKDFGEDNYFTTLNFFTRKPYDIAVELYDSGTDYQSITDWDLFFSTAQQIPIEFSCILFGKINFAEFEPFINSENGMKILINKYDTDFRIDEAVYREITSYLRYIHFISEKVEYDVGNSMAKKFLIDRMRRKQQKMLKDLKSGKVKKQSQISNLIKFCVNSPDFKYNYDSVMNLKINVLYESYYYIVHNDERNNIMSGIYHGTIDTSKMKDKSILNIIPDLHK